jgi:hypothetical protein
MYVKDGIAYAGESQKPIKINTVRTLDNYKLWLRFTTGEEKIFDFTPYLEYKCYQPLKDKATFNSVYIDFGVVVWNEGDIDISPETLYVESIPAESIKKAI